MRSNKNRSRKSKSKRKLKSRKKTYNKKGGNNKIELSNPNNKIIIGDEDDKKIINIKGPFSLIRVKNNYGKEPDDNYINNDELEKIFIDNKDKKITFNLIGGQIIGNEMEFTIDDNKHKKSMYLVESDRSNTNGWDIIFKLENNEELKINKEYQTRSNDEDLYLSDYYFNIYKI